MVECELNAGLWGSKVPELHFLQYRAASLGQSFPKMAGVVSGRCSLDVCAHMPDMMVGCV